MEGGGGGVARGLGDMLRIRKRREAVEGVRIKGDGDRNGG